MNPKAIHQISLKLLLLVRELAD